MASCVTARDPHKQYFQLLSTEIWNLDGSQWGPVSDKPKPC